MPLLVMQKAKQRKQL